MKETFYGRASLALFFVVSLAPLQSCTTTVATSVDTSQQARENIHVLRSIRDVRTFPSSWCDASRTGFTPVASPSLLEDSFTLFAPTISLNDGILTNTKAQRAGDMKTCVGNTTDPKMLNFYAEGNIGSTPFAGRGDCQYLLVDTPEKGITTLRCYLALNNLPAPFVGGLLTSSTLISGVALGGETKPSGYVQTSIVTVRMWR